MERIKRYYLNKRNGGDYINLEQQYDQVLDLGATSVKEAYAHGMSNQPRCVSFNATDEVKAAIATAFNDGYLVEYHWKYLTGSECLNDKL